MTQVLFLVKELRSLQAMWHGNKQRQTVRQTENQENLILYFEVPPKDFNTRASPARRKMVAKETEM